MFLQVVCCLVPLAVLSAIKEARNYGISIKGGKFMEALSEADVGVAIASGAAITREIADITISADDLMELVVLRRLSRALMNRVHGDYRFIVGFNSLLIALGIGGLITPSTSALLHNSSTMMVGIDSMTNLLEETK